MRILSSTILLLLLNLDLNAQQPEREKEPNNQPKTKTNHKTKTKGTDNKAIKKLLSTNGFAITKQTYKQGFSPYIASGVPKFITSDSILMAYTDLLERHIADKQLVNLAMHRGMILKIKNKLPKPSPSSQATSSTRLLIGTAHRILFGKISNTFTPAEKKLIQLEAKRVETHTGSTPPS